MLCNFIFFASKIVLLRDNVENTVEPGGPQMTIWRMRVACWLPKATNTHPQYVILIAFPLQQCLQERPSVLRYTYLACVVHFPSNMPNNHGTRPPLYTG